MASFRSGNRPAFRSERSPPSGGELADWRMDDEAHPNIRHWIVGFNSRPLRWNGDGNDMSHYHTEILLPPTASDIPKAIAEIMQPFDENDDDNGGCAFWDFYVIGGRFSGTKNVARYDQSALQEFYNALTQHKVTVSGLTCGKQEIKPESQIPLVDELWSKHFPEYAGKPCPLFKHSNNQYSSDSLLEGDIMDFADVPASLKADRIIVAGLSYDKSKFEAKEMLVESSWNGCTWQKTDWDGTFGNAIAMLTKQVADCSPKHRDERTPVKGWKAVTVDYHS